MTTLQLIQQNITEINPKTLIAPALITLIVISAHLSFGVLDAYHKYMTAIGIAVLFELALAWFTTGKLKNLASAYVSGNSAGILIRSPFIWPFALCAAIAITSKYVLRYKGRHLWNPTNFAIVIMLFIAADSMAVLSIQWGNHIWAMIVIWLVGLVTLWRVGLFNITATYLLAFVFFSWIRSFITGDTFLTEVAPLTGPMYQLFALFMITDPKTIVKNKKAQIGVVILIAFVEFIFRLGEAVYAPFYALFLVGPLALIIEDWLSGRKNAFPDLK